VFRRFPPPAPLALAALALLAAAALLGGLPGPAGALDPVALLAWLTLVAPAAGVLAAASGASFFPFALVVPAGWLFALVAAELHAPRRLETPLAAAALLVGLFGLGYALGRRSREPARAAGLALLVFLVLSGACMGFGVLANGSALAPAHPRLARALFDLSPLTWAYDCAGWDWGRAQPDVYAGAGIEWFQREPWPATLTGSAVLLVGCFLALLVRAPRSAPGRG